MGERTQTTESTEEDDGDRDPADETVEQKPSVHQERDHSPDAYTTGYDPGGKTRVGIGNAGGDVTKLIRHNEGRHRSDGNHSAREAARDKKRVTESFCSRLDVTSFQQELAIKAMSSMNLDRFGWQKRLDKVALATIKVMVEWDRFHRLQGCSDLADLDEKRLPQWMRDDEEYRDLLDQQDVSWKDLYSTSQLVKRELKKRTFFGHGVSHGADRDDVDIDADAGSQ